MFGAIAIILCNLFLEYGVAEVYQEPTEMRVTFYTHTGHKTASGVWPEEGMCASNREHLGMYAMVYSQNKEFLGSYLCTDIGGNAKLRNGTAIDLFVDDIQTGYDFVAQYGDYQYVMWVERKVENENFRCRANRIEHHKTN